jgi:hypothetical protein
MNIGSRIWSGKRLNHYCRQNLQSPKAVVHEWITEKLWRLYCMFFAPVADGKIYPEAWVREARFTDVFRNGKGVVCISVCGWLIY